MKRNILFMFTGLLIGIVITGAVYAINANEITYKDTTVDQAIDDLYIKTNGIDLTSKTTANNSCYDLQKVTANYIGTNGIALTLNATKVTEDCNSNYTVDISDLGLSNIVYKATIDLGNSTNYNFSNISVSTSSISFRADTNYGQSAKNNYNFLVYYTYEK